MEAEPEYPPPVSIRIPGDLLVEIDRLAKTDDRTRSGMIIRLMREALVTRRAGVGIFTGVKDSP